MIQSIPAFVNYFDGIRNRTLNYINTLPADRIDWSPRAGELTCGDIVRHLAKEPRPALKGGSVKAWRWLMGMVEHEAHHRSQLSSYLSIMDITPPHIYGLGIEDIVALTTT